MFRNRIRECRQKLGLSQTQLAILSGVASPTMSDLELGKRHAWPRIRKALVRILGITEAELFLSGQNNEAGESPGQKKR